MVQWAIGGTAPPAPPRASIAGRRRTTSRKHPPCSGEKVAIADGSEQSRGRQGGVEMAGIGRRHRASVAIWHGEAVAVVDDNPAASIVETEAPFDGAR